MCSAQTQVSALLVAPGFDELRIFARQVVVEIELVEHGAELAAQNALGA